MQLTFIRYFHFYHQFLSLHCMYEQEWMIRHVVVVVQAYAQSYDNYFLAATSAQDPIPPIIIHTRSIKTYIQIVLFKKTIL